MRKRVKQYYHPYGGRRIPWWGKVIIALILLAAVCFGILEGIVLSGGRDAVQGEPKVMVILGCQVKPWGPSILLQDRLDKALDYWQEHPEITIVVSGGQGPDEPVSEAQCMYDYLTGQGVDGAQILLEDQSHNTWENIQYTLELLQSEGLDTDEMLVVSNGFHLARVKLLWGREWEGSYTLSTLAAPSTHFPSRVKMYIREPFALVKSFLFDR